MNSCELSENSARRLIGNPWLAAFLGFLVLLIDFASKQWVDHSLPNSHLQAYVYPYGGIGVFKGFLGVEFSITHTTNRGAAWGVLADYQTPLLYVRMLLVAGLLSYLFFFNKHPSWRIPVALIIAGAVGNIVDFYQYGHVVDMFHFIFWGYDYPVFNVADSAIFIGISWLFFASLAQEPSKKEL